MQLMESFEPGGTSSKNMVHFGQITKSRPPRRFDFGTKDNVVKYGQQDPPAFDLARLSRSGIPINLFYGSKDGFTNQQDIDYLLSKLKQYPSSDVSATRLKGYGHVDYLWADTAQCDVYYQITQKMLAMYRKATQQSIPDPAWFRACQ